MSKYRIVVKDDVPIEGASCYYLIQKKRWWFPFWLFYSPGGHFVDYQRAKDFLRLRLKLEKEIFIEK